MEKMEKELKEILKEMFGQCREHDGVYRAMAEHIGAVDSNAIVEALIDTGSEDHPYPCVQVVITMAEGIEYKAVPNLLIALNAINHLFTTGAFPSFGSMVYYPGLDQVYLSARIPFNPEAVEQDIVNVRYFFSVLYEQLDLFMDFVFFAIGSDTPLSIEDYLDYLDQISDLNDITLRAEELAKLVDSLSEQNKAAKR